MSQELVVKSLGNVLRNELAAVNQYLLHSKILDNLGFKKLANHEYKESLEEFGHVEILMKRILDLGHFPNMQDVAKMHIGSQPMEIIECDYKSEKISYKDVISTMKICDENNDYLSFSIMEKILESEESHIKWLKEQLSIINVVGLKEYMITWI